MTTTHEQIRITKPGNHYRAVIYFANRQPISAEGDTEQSARLSLLDRLITEDQEDITLNGPIVQDLIEHANKRAQLYLVKSVREAWSAIRHTDNATDVSLGYSAIETAAQIVLGGADVSREWVERWPSLTLVLRTVRDAYQEQSEIYRRIDSLL